jgi:hypothetical protein
MNHKILFILSSFIFLNGELKANIIPSDQCAIILMATKNKSEAFVELKKYENIAINPILVESNNGFFAASLGLIKKTESQKFIKDNEKILPKGTYCGNTDRYVSIIRINQDNENNQPSKSIDAKVELKKQAVNAGDVKKEVNEEKIVNNNKSSNLGNFEDQLVERRKSVSYASLLNGLRPGVDNKNDLNKRSDFRDKIEENIAIKIDSQQKNFEMMSGERICIKGPASFYTDPKEFQPREICFQRGGYQIIKFPYMPKIFGKSLDDDLLDMLTKYKNCYVNEDMQNHKRTAFKSININCSIPKELRQGSEFGVSFEVITSFIDSHWKEKLWRIGSAEYFFCGPTKAGFNTNDFLRTPFALELKKKYGEFYAKENGINSDANMKSYIDKSFDEMIRSSQRDLFKLGFSSGVSSLSVYEFQQSESKRCDSGQSVYSIGVVEAGDYDSIFNRIISKYNMRRSSNTTSPKF